MKPVLRRVRDLERRYGPALEAMRKPAIPEGPSGAEELARRLTSRGIVRGPNESLAETTARAMGWNITQLRQYLEGRAYGQAAD